MSLARRTRRGGANHVLIAGLAVALSLAAFVPHAVQAWQKEVSSWDVTLSQALHAYENRETILNSRLDLLAVPIHPAVHVLGLLVVLGVGCRLIADGHRRLGVTVVVTLVGATVLGMLLKEVFERPPVDPGGDGYTFPSGHALRSMAGAAALAVVAWPTRWRWPAAVTGGLAVLLTGIGVVYHEWHWTSDVLAGWYIALAWFGCVWLALRPSLRTRTETGLREGGGAYS